MTCDNPAHGTRKLVRTGEDHLYDDVTNDVRVQCRVKGRVLFPPDTPQAILRTFVQQMAEVFRKVQ